MSGGSFTTTGYGYLQCQPGSATAIQNTQINGAWLEQSDQSHVSLQSAQVTAPTTISGTAASNAHVEQGTTSCTANCLFAAPTTVHAGGNLQAANSGQVQVGDSHTLSVQGGTLSCAGACASGTSSNVVVGSSSGVGGTLAFQGSAPSTCAGGVINLQSQSSLVVAPEATKVCTAPTVVTGTGTAYIQGKLQASSPYVCDHAQTQVTGHAQVEGQGQLLVAPGHYFLVGSGAALSCASCQQPETHSVGCDTCGQAAEIQIVPGPAGPVPATCSGGSYGLKATGCFRIHNTPHVVVQPTEFHGAGQLIVQEGAVHECAHVHTCNHAVTLVDEKSKLRVSGASGQYVCGPSHQLQLQGSVVEHVNIQVQDTIHVQSGGKVACLPAPSGGPTIINAGAKIHIEESAETRIKSNAQLKIAGPCTSYGNGVHIVEQAAVHEVADVHINAHIKTQIQEQAKLRISGPLGQYSCAPAHTLELSGCSVEHVNIQTQDTIRVQSGAKIAHLPCASGAPVIYNAGAKIHIEENAETRIKSSGALKIAGPCTHYGAGSHIVESAAVHEVADVHINAHVNTEINEQAKLRISGNGQYSCESGHALTLKGAIVEHSNVNIQETLKVKAGASVHVQPCASGAPTVIKAGAKINIEQSAKIEIHSNSKLQIAGACDSHGAGPILVSGGHLEAQAPHSCAAPVQVVGGEHTLNCGSQHSYGDVSYDSASKCNLQAGSSGFNAVQVSGRAQLNGQLNIKTAGYAPSGPVTLFKANGSGSLSGSFASCTSDSASIKGAVKHEAGAVTWYPNASQCSGGCVPVA